MKLKKMVYLALTSQGTQRPLFTKHFTPDLTCDSCNLTHDWLKSTSRTNLPADYVIRELIQELKIW